MPLRLHSVLRLRAAYLQQASPKALIFRIQLEDDLRNKACLQVESLTRFYERTEETRREGLRGRSVLAPSITKYRQERKKRGVRVER
jgi:hypothetical protein